MNQVSSTLADLNALFGSWAFPDWLVVSEHDGYTLVQYAGWVFPTVCLLSFGVIASGFLYRRELGRLGWGLSLLAGMLALLILAPATLLDRAWIHGDHFALTQARWAGELRTPSHFEMTLVGLHELELIEERPRDLLGSLAGETYLVGRQTDGSEQWVPVTPVARRALGALRKTAGAGGVAWIDRYDRWLRTRATGGPGSGAETR